ncbi:MAG: hypothetical protein R6V56_01685 [Lentisphaeria bacterium]
MSKFLHITFHFEYTDQVERILDDNGINDYIRVSMIEGRDCDGKHYGTQVYPGNSSVIQAVVDDDKLDAVMQGLREFKQAKNTRHHLQALVLPVEQEL